MYKDIQIEINRFLHFNGKRPTGILLHPIDHKAMDRQNKENIGVMYKPSLQLFGLDIYRTTDIEIGKFKIF
jgi:hypothetical protein